LRRGDTETRRHGDTETRRRDRSRREIRSGRSREAAAAAEEEEEEEEEETKEKRKDVHRLQGFRDCWDDRRNKKSGRDVCEAGRWIGPCLAAGPRQAAGPRLCAAGLLSRPSSFLSL
jgi:hypothetical protein